MTNEISQEGFGNFAFQNVKNSTINITQPLGKSVEYQSFVEQLKTLNDLLSYLPESETQKRIDISKKIYDLENFLEQFRKDVSKLAEVFNRIEINTERLIKAKEFFDNGEFNKSRLVLESEIEKINDEQIKLLKRKDEIENEILPKLKHNSEEFLLLALATQFNYENENRFLDTCNYFENSIKSLPNIFNLSLYAKFLFEHRKFTKAQTLVHQLLSEYINELTTDDISTILNNLGLLNCHQNSYKEAVQNLKKALSIRRKLAKDNPEIYLTDVASTLLNLGIAYRNQDNYDEAMLYYEEALKIYQNLAENNPEIYLFDVAKVLNNLGNLYENQGEHSQALIKLNEALVIKKGLTYNNPHDYLYNIAMTLNNIGVVYGKNFERKRDLSDYKSALEAIAEALRLYRRLAKDNPYSYLIEVSQALNNLGNLHSQTSEHKKALSKYEEALMIRRMLFEENPAAYVDVTTQTLYNIAIYYTKAVPYPEKAIQYLLEMVSILFPFTIIMPHLQPICGDGLRLLIELGMSPEEIAKNIPQTKLD